MRTREVDQVVLVLNGKIGKVFGSVLVKETILISNTNHPGTNTQIPEDHHMSLECFLIN